MFPSLVPECFARCLSPTLAALRGSAHMSMVGNGMHLVTLTAWLFYVACHSIRKDAIRSYVPPLLFHPEVDDVDDEGDEL
jgi:hypothetical protein